MSSPWAFSYCTVLTLPCRQGPRCAQEAGQASANQTPAFISPPAPASMLSHHDGQTFVAFCQIFGHSNDKSHPYIKFVVTVTETTETNTLITWSLPVSSQPSKAKYTHKPTYIHMHTHTWCNNNIFLCTFHCQQERSLLWADMLNLS